MSVIDFVESQKNILLNNNECKQANFLPVYLIINCIILQSISLWIVVLNSHSLLMGKRKVLGCSFNYLVILYDRWNHLGKPFSLLL